jgi:cytochrome c oxidase cbb3-type subunit III
MKKIFKISFLFSLLIKAGIVHADTPADGMNTPMSGNELVLVLIMLLFIMVMLVVAFVLFNISLALKKMLPTQTGVDAEYEKDMNERSFWQKIAGLRPMKYEQSMMMEHAYDGILEIDNPIPGWFMTLFYGSIVVAVTYIFAYHVVGDGQIMTTEYKEQMAEGEAIKEAFMKKFANSINENNVVVLKEPKAIDEGKKLFTQNCVACHAADGGGGVGPNLTDEFWIHGGNVKAIYHTISEGVAEKGMISWKKSLNPLQIQQLASYIFTLKGTKPAKPKEPQGEKEDVAVNGVKL